MAVGLLFGDQGYIRKGGTQTGRNQRIGCLIGFGDRAGIRF